MRLFDRNHFQKHDIRHSLRNRRDLSEEGLRLLVRCCCVGRVYDLSSTMCVNITCTSTQVPCSFTPWVCLPEWVLQCVCVCECPDWPPVTGRSFQCKVKKIHRMTFMTFSVTWYHSLVASMTSIWLWHATHTRAHLEAVLSGVASGKWCLSSC